MRHQMNPTQIQAFSIAGKATITLQNIRNNNHFTYSIQAPRKRTPNGGYSVDHVAGVRFVKVLTGPSNEGDYSFIGCLFSQEDGSWLYRPSKKSDISPEAPSQKAFAFMWQHKHQLPPALVVFHEGKCGRCAKPLTVPASIESGFGPECITKV